MYRVRFETERAIELQCDSLARALDVIRALVGDIYVLPSGDDTFWLCCRGAQPSDCEVVARIFAEGRKQERAPAKTAAHSYFALKAQSSEEHDPAPESEERSIFVSNGIAARARRTPTGT